MRNKESTIVLFFITDVDRSSLTDEKDQHSLLNKVHMLVSLTAKHKTNRTTT